MKCISLLFLLITSISCNSQKSEQDKSRVYEWPLIKQETQIGEYVTSVFEDSNRNLWFGTIGKGIAKYNGIELIYYTTKDGLPSDRVTGIIQDDHDTYWLKTGEGLSKFDGITFTNYTIAEDFFSNTISKIFIDSKGKFWVGTWGGVFIFDGNSFTKFNIPFPEIQTQINEDTKNWITEIKEDLEGNIWFARDGFGFCKYDGETFTHYLKKDGLHSNNITELEFDTEGSIWVGSRVAERDNIDPEKRFGKGGINKVLNNKVKSFPDIKGFNNGDVYSIYKDIMGDIWISTIKNGVYQYMNQEFIHHEIPISIMGIAEDYIGNIWFGGAGGLYKINKQREVINVTTEGPWK